VRCQPIFPTTNEKTTFIRVVENLIIFGVMKMADLINRKQTKKFILEKFKSMRPHLGVERVSKDALDQIDAFVRARVIESIKRRPSNGRKTFMDFIR
jgi:hypothetical protein